MLNILFTNYCRMVKRLPSVLVMTVITVVSIALAVYITGIQQISARIALVTDRPAVSVQAKGIAVTVLKTQPPASALVKQQYDAVVTVGGDGRFTIRTLRNAQFRSLLESVFNHTGAPAAAGTAARGVGVNIFGFLMMFLLMGTFTNLFTFAQDKEEGQLARIAAAPLRFGSYLAAQFVYALSMFLPAYLMLAVMQALGFKIGFSLSQYALLFLLLGTLGIAFTLLLNACIKKPDNASMFGNSLLVLTTVLSGSFYSFSKNNAVLDAVVQIFPQKQLLAFAESMQNGHAAPPFFPAVYAALFALALFAAAYVRLRVLYIKKI